MTWPRLPGWLRQWLGMVVVDEVTRLRPERLPPIRYQMGPADGSYGAYEPGWHDEAVSGLPVGRWFRTQPEVTDDH